MLKILVWVSFLVNISAGSQYRLYNIDRQDFLNNIEMFSKRLLNHLEVDPGGHQSSTYAKPSYISHQFVQNHNKRMADEYQYNTEDMNSYNSINQQLMMNQQRFINNQPQYETKQPYNLLVMNMRSTEQQYPNNNNNNNHNNMPEYYPPENNNRNSRQDTYNNNNNNNNNENQNYPANNPQHQQQQYSGENNMQQQYNNRENNREYSNNNNMRNNYNNNQQQQQQQYNQQKPKYPTKGSYNNRQKQNSGNNRGHYNRNQNGNRGQKGYNNNNGGKRYPMIEAAVKSMRTVEVVKMHLPPPNTEPHVIDIGGSPIPIVLKFNSFSSPIRLVQKHSPAKKNEPVEETRSMEEPQMLYHEVLKPIIQEVREIITPYRKVTQEIRPVEEEIHTIVAKMGKNKKIAQTSTTRRPSYGIKPDDESVNIQQEVDQDISQVQEMIDENVYSNNGVEQTGNIFNQDSSPPPTQQQQQEQQKIEDNSDLELAQEQSQYNLRYVPAFLQDPINDLLGFHLDTQSY